MEDGIAEVETESLLREIFDRFTSLQQLCVDHFERSISSKQRKRGDSICSNS